VRSETTDHSQSYAVVAEPGGVAGIVNSITNSLGPRRAGHPLLLRICYRPVNKIVKPITIKQYHIPKRNASKNPAPDPVHAHAPTERCNTLSENELQSMDDQRMRVRLE
jgi:hypothetical protein